jgi:phosphonate transport system substrate-binding protein
MKPSFRFRRSLLAGSAAMLAPLLPARAQPSASATGSTLSIGVLPNVSARLLVTQYQPMREFFESQLGRGVEIVTAADFRAFNERTLRGDYQLVVTAANLGRLAQIDAGWQPIAIYEPRIPALLVAAADNPDSGTAQLRGKALAAANPQSLVALLGLQWLRAQGLQAGTDFRLLLTANDDSLGAVLRNGEAPLAIMSRGEFAAKPEALRSQLRIVTEVGRVPGFLVLANPKLPESERQRLKSVMLGFSGSEEGRRFFSVTGFQQIREVTEAELKSMDVYLDPTRRGLAGRE